MVITRLALFLLLSPLAAHAGDADVLSVDIQAQGEGRYRITVTVRHEDSGWDHYADRWEVLGPEGTVLATRILAHPHVHEQPFTRSLEGVRLPDEVAEVTIRAHDKRHGFGGQRVTVALPR